VTREGPGSVVDLHTHLLAGVDDGARSASESRDALGALREQGVSAAAATPHLAASLAENDPDGWWERLDAFDLAWDALRGTAGTAAPDVRLERGVELRLDAPVPELDDRRVRLGGTRYVLVEFATLQMPSFGARQIESVVGRGGRAVLAHPERYRGVGGRMDAAASWREAGALFQVNAGSLVGQYGPGPGRVAWRLLERGWADVVASDYHARGAPAVREAREAVEARGGGEQAELLFSRNPARILDGEGTVEVPPLERPGMWGRLRSLLGLG
jgi:protein-tyrosine phosphatase